MAQPKLPEGLKVHTIDDPTFDHEEAVEWDRCVECNSQSTTLGTRGKLKGLCPFCQSAVLNK